jgi:dCTP deaminase
MSFWSSETLRARAQAEQLIDTFDPDRVKHGAYELGVGPQAFVTSDPGDDTWLKANEKLVVPPGQFGLLMTRETVQVPVNAIGFISIRASIKFRGLINVSGFHVDPGFKGKLKFAVYNAGSQDIVLDQDQRVFMLWYANLDQQTTDGYGGQRPYQNVITSDDVMRIQGEVASPAALREKIEDLRKEFDDRLRPLEGFRQLITAVWVRVLGSLVLLLIGVLFGWALDRIWLLLEAAKAQQ